MIPDSGTSENRSHNAIWTPRINRTVEMVSRDHPTMLSLFMRVKTLAQTRNQAIKAFCLECMGYSRPDVRDCGTKSCPLWKFRPFQAKKRKETNAD